MPFRPFGHIPSIALRCALEYPQYASQGEFGDLVATGKAVLRSELVRLLQDLGLRAREMLSVDAAQRELEVAQS